MDIISYEIGRKHGGGGGEISVESLSATENGTYTAPEGKAYSPVVVNVPNPSTGKKTITSMNEVDVTDFATAQVADTDLVAGNIKKDVNILGVVGTYEGSGGLETIEVFIVDYFEDEVTLTKGCIIPSERAIYT